jgi:hypothetical protein
LRELHAQARQLHLLRLDRVVAVLDVLLQAGDLGVGRGLGDLHRVLVVARDRLHLRLGLLVGSDVDLLVEVLEPGDGRIVLALLRLDRHLLLAHLALALALLVLPVVLVRLPGQLRRAIVLVGLALAGLGGVLAQLLVLVLDALLLGVGSGLEGVALDLQLVDLEEDVVLVVQRLELLRLDLDGALDVLEVSALGDEVFLDLAELAGDLGLGLGEGRADALQVDLAGLLEGGGLVGGSDGGLLACGLAHVMVLVLSWVKYR